ncbi:MAG: oligoendopeptidase F [Spirochaetaceae bacterium]|jgi:oligoendopeptidase F|nr:oligoendopeptidase F [Spirochaetaceae bacterium]
MQNRTIPIRSEVDEKDRWDLSKLYPNDDAWNTDLAKYEKLSKKIALYKGTLGASAKALAEYLDFAEELGLLEERLSYYAELRQCEDEGSDAARSMTGRFVIIASHVNAESAWAAPEIQGIPDERVFSFLKEDCLKNYKVYLEKLLRFKPYILSEKEERIIAMQREACGLPSEAFSVLTNVDFDFGAVNTDGGMQPLTQSTWQVFMEHKNRSLRETAWKQFYNVFSAHKTALAALYAGSVKQDAVSARIRGFESARASALFPDNVKLEVYDNLIASVNANLAPLHRYYNLRRRSLGLNKLAHWDVYVPITQTAEKNTCWEEAVTLVSDALAPLGEEYTGVLRAGLMGRWADRYENKGKRSGAFSAGSFSAEPYILMNYKTDSVRDIFTMAHEGGHSMHSWYSARSNPFMSYSYTIFEAEVASTFNEELLFRHLLKNAPDGEFRAAIIGKRIDDILATLYRQTMFAEFEKNTHALEESGEALTVDVLRGEYRKLLEKYFGGDMELDALSDLEGLRIPHFYRAFYVYKYATGISASLALAERVLGGGEKEKEDYFTFLKSGGSRFPIDSLKAAGVDMSSPDPVNAACKRFDALVSELEKAMRLE